MDDAYGEAMESVTSRLRALVRDAFSVVRCVVVSSAKRTVFTGGDLAAIMARSAEREVRRWRREQGQRLFCALKIMGFR